MEYRAYLIRVKKEKLEDYVDIHRKENFWKELLEEMEKAGFLKMIILRQGEDIIIFEEANVAHLGDVFFNGMYPFIDISGGGSVRGIIAAVDRILPMLNEETKIIPGHGPLATLEDLQKYRSMLMLVSARIQALIDEGKTKEQVITLRPTTNFDADWAWSFLPADRWTGLIYDSLVESADEGRTD